MNSTIWIFISNTIYLGSVLQGVSQFLVPEILESDCFQFPTDFFNRHLPFPSDSERKKKHRKVTFQMFLTFQRYQNKSIKDSTDLNKLFINLGFEVVMNVNSQSS